MLFEGSWDFQTASSWAFSPSGVLGLGFFLLGANLSCSGGNLHKTDTGVLVRAPSL